MSRSAFCAFVKWPSKGSLEPCIKKILV